VIMAVAAPSKIVGFSLLILMFLSARLSLEKHKK